MLLLALFPWFGWDAWWPRPAPIQDDRIFSQCFHGLLAGRIQGRGDWESTLRTLRDALEMSPDNVPLRDHLVSLCMERGLLDEAERILRQGLDLAPESDQLTLALAHCFYQ